MTSGRDRCTRRGRYIKAIAVSSLPAHTASDSVASGASNNVATTAIMIVTATEHRAKPPFPLSIHRRRGRRSENIVVQQSPRAATAFWCCASAVLGKCRAVADTHPTANMEKIWRLCTQHQARVSTVRNLKCLVDT